jgi:hypothetical protein
VLWTFREVNDMSSPFASPVKTGRHLLFSRMG